MQRTFKNDNWREKTIKISLVQCELSKTAKQECLGIYISNQKVLNVEFLVKLSNFFECLFLQPSSTKFFWILILQQVLLQTKCWV